MESNNNDWISPNQKPEFHKHILLHYNNEIRTGFLDTDGQWYEYGGNKLDQRLLSGWKEL